MGTGASMRVWVVMHGYEYEAGQSIAVFSSEEEARSWISRLIDGDADFGMTGESYTLLSFILDEFTLDE
jgi:hypothetical protein